MSMFKKLKKRIFGRSCRQVSRLISDMQERPLGAWDRLVQILVERRAAGR